MLYHTYVYMGSVPGGVAIVYVSGMVVVSVELELTVVMVTVHLNSGARIWLSNETKVRNEL